MTLVMSVAYTKEPLTAAGRPVSPSPLSNNADSVKHLPILLVRLTASHTCRLRDRSLITGRGGGYKMGKSLVRKPHPNPQDMV